MGTRCGAWETVRRPTRIPCGPRTTPRRSSPKRWIDVTAMIHSVTGNPLQSHRLLSDSLKPLSDLACVSSDQCFGLFPGLESLRPLISANIAVTRYGLRGCAGSGFLTRRMFTLWSGQKASTSSSTSATLSPTSASSSSTSWSESPLSWLRGTSATGDYLSEHFAIRTVRSMSRPGRTVRHLSDRVVSELPVPLAYPQALRRSTGESRNRRHMRVSKLRVGDGTAI